MQNEIGALIPIVALFIPIVAIVGGITAAAFRTHAQQKVAELHMQERIAAINKGIDPATLPPVPTVADPGEVIEHGLDPATRAARTAQGLVIGGLITLFSGVGVSLVFWAIPQTAAFNLWVIGVIPALVGAALLLSSLVVKPRPAVPPQA